MYVPLAVKRPFVRKDEIKAHNIEVIYSEDYKEIDRLFYHRKRKKILAAIENRIALEHIDLVHSHYLFSAGGVAYALKKVYNIDYIAAIRNTDLNYFFRYAVHLRGFGLRIMCHAARLVFLCPAHKDALIRGYVPESLKESMWNKSVVIPNGIHDFWLDNRHLRCNRKVGNSIKLLFVGEFKKNKNIRTIVKVVKLLCRRGYDARLDLVGDGSDAKAVKRLAERSQNIVNICGWIDSKDELLRKYREADVFVMPSITETFGLTYIEAMSQGLPVIYTKGQGIDGYFKDGVVGFACQPLNAEEIASKVVQIAQDYNRMSANTTKSVDKFSWSKIGRDYEKLYSSLCHIECGHDSMGN
jgi:glycosyltransferase involved in cell wall biosynthesis